VFLDVPETAWVCANALAFAFRDRFPVTPGHTLIVTRRVTPDWFTATPDERTAVAALVEEVKRQLDAEYAPHGYNVGFNAGAAAGQTVMHLHVHVIPRYRGDMDDPRGGVRHVIPSKANYLRAVAPLATGGDDDPFSRHVIPLFERATDIAIVAAFVQESGLDRIRAAAFAALRRGARIRVITGDYLNITQAGALETLLDWEQAAQPDEDDGDGGAPAAGHEASDGGAPAAGDEGGEGDEGNEGGEGGEGDEGGEGGVFGKPGRFLARVIEVARLPARQKSFHPKSWRFEARYMGVAFVGSSNLSRSALESGIEWNLRVDRDRDAPAYARVRDAFEALWERARPLDPAWIEAYAQRARKAQLPLPPGEVEADDLEPPPEPHAVQREALDRLRACRAEGRTRALVVLATGLGKTWLAAFDHAQLRDELGRRPRLLFLAHRAELLRQAARTYRRLQRAAGTPARVGWFLGDSDDLAADLVFASVAKLARPASLARLANEPFDYVVVDEVHHAAAASYRRILDRVDPAFLLGLTATPDRADAADILGLFDDFVAYRADMARGIDLGRLIPFHYFGVKDDIDYANLPWRNRRFDPDALSQAAQTEARMQTLWRAWAAHPGARTLVFCCSVAHATFVRGWLAARGIKVAAVHAGEGSDDREQALLALERGELAAVCAVDMFNEGIDVPSIDRVVMLRPTESSVVFLQQLGRGLRAAPGKASVTVIDFVGNHRVFLERLRALLSLGGAPDAGALLALLQPGGAAELPAGCSVELALEAKDLLARLFQVGGAGEVERAYRELCLERGTDDAPTSRPTAGELQRMGYLPHLLRDRHGGWFDFVRGEAGLAPDELQLLEVAGGFLRELETTPMTRCFKMVTLEVLLEHDALLAGMRLDDLATRAHAWLRRSPELFADVSDDELRVQTLDDALRARWIAYWKKNPISAWTGRDGRAWFRLDDGVFRLALDVPLALAAPLHRLTRELVDYRLARYRDSRRRNQPTSESFACKLTWNQRDPIIKLPPRERATIPEGETDVRLPDGAVWQFRFAKEFCNVARPAGTARNQLPDLLRTWFGPRAGQPGTAFQIRFHASPGGLWVEPVQAAVIDLASRRNLVAYPDLRAAAGHVATDVEPPGEELVSLPIEAADPELFAVRVSGTSMDGGKQPLHDGDWAVMRLARSLPASAVEGRVVLVQVEGDAHGAGYQIKRLQRDGRGWQLTSDNPAGPTFAATEVMVPIARLERSLRPEDLAPPTGTVCDEAELARLFGLDELPPRSDRHAGHLFVFIDQPGVLLIEPDRLRFTGVTPRPAETAFVLARRDATSWQYLGVARQTGDRGTWSLPAVDFATWRTWGKGREVSRRLPEGALDNARTAAAALLERPEAQRWIQRGERRARIVGGARDGGLRIDGGPGGFVERTVSLVDLAWVIHAAEDVAATGGLLDEARVNKLRYLDGTPKESTRWIDTGWAIAAWHALGADASDPSSEP
jgi:superfamily II DNA or RNA helicase/diadenosine tetraphosphate (Ap4A) HIT family hydrolase/SOS-response transcriptional repressor LexA